MLVNVICIFIVLLLIVGCIVEWWEETRTKCLIPLLLCAGVASGQVQPEPVSEWFELECDFYISTTGKDSAYMEPAALFMNEHEFFLIRGQDTTSRRLCKFDPYVSQLELSCGDWVRPVRNWDGEVTAVWYGEKGVHYYFNKKFIRRNLPPKE